MGNEKKIPFNRKLFLEKVVTEFINKNSERTLRTAFDGYINLIDKDFDPANKKQNEEKKRILRNSFDQFNNPMIKKQIEEVREKLHPHPQIFVRAVSKTLEERILRDVKRKYNMSKLASTFTIETTTLPNGTVEKNVSYQSLNQEPRIFANSQGEEISIQLIGRFEYRSSKATAPNYTNKYRVSIPGYNDDVVTYEVFSNIDMNIATDPKHSDYTDAVVNTLLSRNNIELSRADGYIGEINTESTLEVSKEKFEPGFYTYQISPKQALVFDGEKIGAIRAYNKELEKQKTTKEGTDR